MMDNIMSQVYDYKIVPEKEQAEKNGTPVQPETVQLHRASVHSKKKDDETSGAGCCWKIDNESRKDYQFSIYFANCTVDN